jgi:colanic acid/amylovoran biosynthesis glycosyltransferase
MRSPVAEHIVESTAGLAGRRLGMIVSRFPKLTETFVLQEILELERQGVAVELFPLMREREEVRQNEVEVLIRRAHFRTFGGHRLWFDNLLMLLQRPGRYLRALSRVIGASWRSPRFLAGAVVFFPVAVSFARVVEALRIEHVHAQFANHPAVVALVIRMLTGVPFSFTARGSDIHVDRTMLREKMEAAAFAIAVSEHNKQVIVRACGERFAGSVHVVYGGIDIGRFVPEAPTAAADPFTIVSIGRFEEVKGHAILLEACGIMLQRGVEFRCDLFGDGDLRPVLEEQVSRLGLTDRVVMHGNRPHPEIADALRRSSTCVLATVRAADGKQEGIPNVLKEAMATGIPVVSSKISGIPELVDDGVTGILVPQRDAGALAEALMSLERDSEMRARLGRAGRARIERDFELGASTRRRAALFFQS